MRRRSAQLPIARDALCVVCAAALLLWATTSAWRRTAKAPPRLNGPYSVTFAGSVTGTGRAVVNPQKVRIDGTVRDAAGNELRFTVPDLDMDRSTYRFNGSGTVGSASVHISGRVDPDDTALGRCRLTATFLATDGTAGRVVGSHD
jgi:hypothetical protein